MKVNVKLGRKIAGDSLRISFDGEAKTLSDENREASFEYFGKGRHRLEAELISEDAIDRKDRIKNPIGRFFANILIVLFYFPLIHLFDSYNRKKGAQIYFWLKHINPFEIRKAFAVEPEEGKDIVLNFTPPCYSPSRKEYSMPKTELLNCKASEEFSYVHFRRDYVNRALRYYVLSVYTLIFIVLALLFTVFVLVAIQGAKRIPVQSPGENIFCIAGMCFSFAVLIFLAVMAVLAAVRTVRLCREICKKYGNM